MTTKLKLGSTGMDGWRLVPNDLVSVESIFFRVVEINSDTPYACSAPVGMQRGEKGLNYKISIMN